MDRGLRIGIIFSELRALIRFDFSPTSGLVTTS